MVSTTLVVVLALVAAYIGLVLYLRTTQDEEEDEENRRFQLVGPLLMLKTQWGKKTIDKLAKGKHVGLIADIFILITILAGAVMLVLVVYQNTLLFTHTDIVRERPPQLEETLAIPGINPVIPVGYGLFALLVALVIHEGGHGVLARHGKMRVKSLGLLFFVIPIGAFVEPDEAELQRASLREKLRLFSAGPGPNIVLAFICVLAFAQIFVPAMDAKHDGVAMLGVIEGLPADEAGLEGGMYITGLSGQELQSYDDFQQILAHQATTPLSTGAKFTGLGDSPGPLTYQVSVPAETNGTYRLGGEYRFLGAMDSFQASPNSTVQVTCPGAPTGQVQDNRSSNGALTRQTPSMVACGSSFTVTIELDAPEETRYWTVVEDLPTGWSASALEGGHTAERINVTTWRNGQTGQATILPLDKFEYYQERAPQLANESMKGVPFLGVNPAGSDQLEQITASIQHPFETQGVARGSLFYIAMPFANLQPFPSTFHDIYEPTGLFEGWGDGYWITANSLYWLFWINVVLGTFNALPFWVLDGGHMFRQSLHSWLRGRKGIRDDDLIVEDPEEGGPHYVARDPLVQLELDAVDRQAGMISRSVTMVMLVLILAPLIVPQFL